MKRKSIEPEAPAEAAEISLYEALLTLRDEAEMQAFFHDLCTPAELEALRDRWRVVPLLAQDVPYREIHDRTAVSVTTVGRVARCLQMGEGVTASPPNDWAGWRRPPRHLRNGNPDEPASDENP